MKKVTAESVEGLCHTDSPANTALVYQRPELVRLGKLSQLVRGRTGNFNDGNSPNPRETPQ